ncbi:hypothetical protein ACLOJK_021655 [Asimina triloba]
MDNGLIHLFISETPQTLPIHNTIPRNLTLNSDKEIVKATEENHRGSKEMPLRPNSDMDINAETANGFINCDEIGIGSYASKEEEEERGRGRTDSYLWTFKRRDVDCLLDMELWTRADRDGRRAFEMGAELSMRGKQWKGFIGEFLAGTCGLCKYQRSRGRKGEAEEMGGVRKRLRLRRSEEVRPMRSHRSKERTGDERRPMRSDRSRWSEADLIGADAKTTLADIGRRERIGEAEEMGGEGDETIRGRIDDAISPEQRKNRGRETMI